MNSARSIVSPFRVLALDTSTHTGWAHDVGADDAPSGEVEYGTLDLSGWRPAVVGRSYVQLLDFVMHKCAAARITHVIIEKPLNVYAHAGFQGTKARKDPDLAAALMGFVVVAETAARKAGCQCFTVAPETVRAGFLGRGRGKPKDPKTAVTVACRQMGWKPRDDNQADALATWFYSKRALEASRSLFDAQT
ncbi:MAG: hypothetical protein HC889_17365 [Synechococcaceae cyanobacterium SM1_2_3]|nr:hypothetical protein [Synechococcaceae cyanobacterium SM1_2_3]